MSLHFGRRDRKARERHTISTTLADSSSLLNSSSNTHMGPAERAGIGRKWWNKWISTLSISFHYLQAWFHNCRLKRLLYVPVLYVWMCSLAKSGCTNLVWTAQKPERIARLCVQAEIRVRLLNKEGLIRGWEFSLGGQPVGHDRKGTAVMR